MELADLETFCTIARHGSLSRAAQALYIAQPTVSHRLKALEAELGQKLFRRSSQGVTLTAEGEIFLPHAVRAVEAAREGRRALSQEAADTSPLLLASAPTFASYRLPSLLAALVKARPEVDLRVHVARSDEVLRAVRQGQAHAGFVRMTVEEEDLETVVIETEPILLVASPKALPPSDGSWLDGPFIRYDRSSPFWHELDVILARSGALGRVTMELDSLEGVKAMVRAGLGAAFLPRWSVEAEIRSDILREISLPVELPGRTLALVSRKGEIAHPALRHLRFIALQGRDPS